MTRALIVAVLIAVLSAGCGNETSPPTTTLAEGSRIGADRYLADVAAAARAVRAFNAELATVGSPATPARLRDVAPRLAAPLDAARLAAQRLDAARLDDQRLEAQRVRDADSFATAVDAMQRVVLAAEARDPAQVKAAASDYAAALDALRTASR